MWRSNLQSREMYLLLSWLQHLNQRFCGLFCTTLKHRATFQGWGEAFRGDDGHRSDNWFSFICPPCSSLFYFLALKCLFLHINCLSFHLSFFQNFNLYLELSFIYLLNAWHKALISAWPSGNLNFNCCLQDAEFREKPLVVQL